MRADLDRDIYSPDHRFTKTGLSGLGMFDYDYDYEYDYELFNVLWNT